MFDAIRENKRIAQIILAILIVPFAFFGLESYFSGAPGAATVAEVGGSIIKQNEFERALGEERERLRQAVGERAATELLDSEKFRQAVLDKLLTQRVLARYAVDARLTVSNEQLQQAISRIDAFQENGQFSPALYQALLRQRNMSSTTFESMLAQDMRAEQLVGAIAETSLAAGASVRRLLAAQLEERVAREMRFPIAPHLPKIEVGEAAIQAYYDANLAGFERPERVKAEYIALDERVLQDRIEIAEDDIRKTYDGGDYARPEERRVRHIMIEAAPDAGESTLAKAKGKIDEIAAALRQDPSRFPELAKKESQDAGTKNEGGDLGLIARGQMVRAFDEAAFALEQGEISGPVRTGHGFHLIQVLEIRPGGDKRPLEEVREEIADELREQAAARKFVEEAEKFAELVFNQAPDSLSPAAEAFGLEIRRTGWIDRGSENVGEFQDSDLAAALFTDDA
ncbi:MAG: SurA N-terminal domain-containing protein, partial [Azoarcus sp.]|nr:SurA N-terminal domain-containing protein [Azoarcus sp.]